MRVISTIVLAAALPCGAFDISTAASAVLRATTASRLPACVVMLPRGRPRKNAAPDPPEEEELREQTDQQPEELVDPMTTSLGREEDLKPYPGPPVVEERVSKGPVSLYVHFNRFTPGHAPNEALQQAYTGWLADHEARPEISLCYPHYMLAQQSLDGWWESDQAVVLTDDDIARFDADEEAAQAAREAARAEGDESLASDESAPAMRGGPAFVLGHLLICRAPDLAAAAAWAKGDPVEAASGYAQSCVHEWLQSDEPELNVRSSGEVQQPYCVHCLDRADAGSLRADTRPKHLEWLKESGRVNMAGPLLAPAAAGAAEGERVGTLLLVNGDDLDEVSQWAKTDPYNAAGLFESVTVAPLSVYSMEDDEE